MDYSHTFELPKVNEACTELISRNAEYLINYIYEHTEEEPFTDPRVRVGLVLKTLLRSGNDSVTVNSSVIEPATKDLSDLANNSSSQVERNIYIEELKFLRSCTLLDDLISLNTAVF
jgi:hypothetical protein